MDGYISMFRKKRDELLNKLGIMVPTNSEFELNDECTTKDNNTKKLTNTKDMEYQLKSSVQEAKSVDSLESLEHQKEDTKTDAKIIEAEEKICEIVENGDKGDKGENNKIGENMENIENNEKDQNTQCIEKETNETTDVAIDELDTMQSDILKHTLKNLVNTGVIDKIDERDIIILKDSMENIASACEALRIDNEKLKLKIKSLSDVTIDNIIPEPEEELKNSDEVNDLQSEVDKLRKEMALLRKLNENETKLFGIQISNNSEQNDEKNNVEESDNNLDDDLLNIKIESYEQLQNLVSDLELKSQYFDDKTADLANVIAVQGEYIDSLEKIFDQYDSLGKKLEKRE